MTKVTKIITYFQRLLEIWREEKYSPSDEEQAGRKF